MPPRDASSVLPTSPVTHSAPSELPLLHLLPAQTLAEALDPYAEARASVARLREEACEEARPKVKAGAAPIRVMARMVAELGARCRELGIPEEVLQTEVVNRTIGDVDLRRISARDDGQEYVSLADDMGVALPGERIDGYRATGERYKWIRDRMMAFERQLLKRNVDLRIYDLPATGNSMLREMLQRHMRRLWGYAFPATQLYLSLGSLDGLDKFWRGYAMAERACNGDRLPQMAIAFPAPGFNVPEWQAKSFGYRMHRLCTRAEDAFKVTPKMLRAALEEAPDLRIFYLTVSNNPTAFAYSRAELRALGQVIHDASAATGRELILAADLAYIGTGDPTEDRERMQAFNAPGIREHSVLFNSFSKSHTLTGDRFGYVVFGSGELAERVGAGWANSMATLPADWQLRYMATVQLFNDHPELEARIRSLYRHRRSRLVKQLQCIKRERGIFAEVNLDDGGTVYNWSRLEPGEDVFSLFEKTGIAGVPGSAFGYTDDYIRFSVGCIPVPEGEC